MFQCVLNKDTDTIFLFYTLIFFCTADAIKTSSCPCGIFIQELINLDGLCDLIQESTVVWQFHNDCMFLCRKHTQCRIRIITAIWCDDRHTDIIRLVALKVPVIYFLIEWEQITTAVTIFFVCKNFLEDYSGCLSDNLSHFYGFIIDGIIDFLFFIRQEDINFSILLH